MTLYLLLSFDDTSEFDVKAAELLEKYRLKGTFYLDTERIDKRLTMDEVKWISEFNEIGAHTVTHRDLTKMSTNEALWEITESKRRLEAIIEKPVTSFAYPYGIYNENVVGLVAEAGFLSGRTTEPFNTDLDKEPYKLKVTLWAYPHAYRHLLKAVKRLNLYYLITNPLLLKRWNKLAELLLERLVEKGDGVFHILIHADAIEKRSEWAKLEDVFNQVRSMEGELKICTTTEYVSEVGQSCVHLRRR